MTACISVFRQKGYKNNNLSSGSICNRTLVALKVCQSILKAKMVSMKFSHIRKVFSYLYVTAWLSMLLVAFAATPSESAGVPRSSSEPVIVYVTIFIVDVDEISSANQSFDANVYLQYRWRDPKLAHQGSEAIVRPLNDVWNPKIYVVNQQKMWTTLPEIVTIAPDGEVLYRQRI
jgi:hypothetical protein